MLHNVGTMDGQGLDEGQRVIRREGNIEIGVAYELAISKVITDTEILIEKLLGKFVKNYITSYIL